MAFITITDDVNLINILDGNTGLNSTINKPFDVTVNPTEIYITIKSALEIVQINFDDVLVPVTANIYALRDLIASYNNTGTGAGGATAANQLIEIAKLDNIKANTDPSTVGTETNIASSVANQTLLAANVSRKGATIYNDSTQVLYLKLGAGASATSYTIQLDGGDYYEVPFKYIGIIDGLWAVANGNARVTELT